MLIGVAGLNGSGKDTVAYYLVMKHGFAHRDLGQEIRDELKRQGKDFLDRNLMIDLGNERRKEFGFNYWCKRAIESVGPRDLVVTSIRNPAEVDEIRSRGGVIVEVFADQLTRFERTAARVRLDSTAHGDVQSIDDFRAKEERELKSDDPSKQQLLKCISTAEYKLDNNGTFEQLYELIELLLIKLEARGKVG